MIWTREGCLTPPGNRTQFHHDKASTSLRIKGFQSAKKVHDGLNNVLGIAQQNLRKKAMFLVTMLTGRSCINETAIYFRKAEYKLFSCYSKSNSLAIMNNKKQFYTITCCYS
jgi:hypothetical protein